MKINHKLFRMNRNLIICLLVSTAVSTVAAQAMAGYASYINTTVAVALGYMAFFGTLPVLFWRDNRSRYSQMDRKSVRHEIAKVISSIGIGEIVYFAVIWLTLYYLLEIGIEPYQAALIAKAAASAVYLSAVSVILKASKTLPARIGPAAPGAGAVPPTRRHRCGHSPQTAFAPS